MEPTAPAPAELAAYLTVDEVAALLRVSTKTISRWARSDVTMPALRIGGGTVRFHRQRLEAWLRTREQGTGRARLKVAP
jgi:excisionase family DNA binding protein